MIRRHPNTTYSFIFLQAIAVAIICLGSLINFHQYKIWGKPLIPTFVGYKRDIEKYSKSGSFSKFSRSDHFSQKYFHSADAIFPSGTFSLFSEAHSDINPDFSATFQPSPRIYSCGLRAPPAI